MTDLRDGSARPGEQDGESPALLSAADGDDSPTRLAVVSRFFELADDLFCVIGRDGRFKLLNPACERLLGWTLEELKAGTALERVHEEDLERASRGLRVMPTPPPSRTELRLRCKDGSFRRISWSLVFLPSEDLLYAVGRDITALRQAEEARGESERLLVQAQRAARLGSYTIDLATGRWLCSENLSEVLGVEPEELKTREAFLALVHPEFRPLAVELLRRCSEGERAELDFRIVRPRDGATRWVQALAEPVLGPDGKPARLRGTVQDVEDRKRVEAELQRARQLESLGLLAGGIAHDFNNLLTVMAGNQSLARSAIHELPGSQPLERLLEESAAALARAKDLTQQLLTFSKGGAPVKKLASIARVVREGLDYALRGTQVEARIEVEPGLWAAEIDAAQIGQVVHELALNASAAMGGKGLLRIEARNERLEPGAATSLPPGPYVRLSFRDSGPGIPEESLAQVFDPYYSAGERTGGLGLATAHSIARRHGGSLGAESAAGGGACFTLRLPAQPGAVPALGAPPPPRRESPRRPRVLVLDDEPSIRTLLSRMLRVIGCDMVGVADGEEAVARYAAALREGTAFDFVILDLTVPGGQGGRETLARLKGVDPAVRAVVSSGYATDPVLADLRGAGFVAAIPKPYTLEELQAVVDRVLAEA